MRTYPKKKRHLLLAACMAAALAVTFLGQIKAPAGVTAATVTDYLAKATPYYKHPVTGKIEDPGNNEGLGQSMTESVLYSKALIEEISDGKTYATIRIFLTDNISNVRLWSQRTAKDSWTKASAVIMQENMNGKYCSDYRLQIPDKTAILRMRFYVEPMGRDVVFYIRFSNLKKGSGDFITSGKASVSKSTTKSSAKSTTKNTSAKTTANTAASTQSANADSTKTGTAAKNTANGSSTVSANTDTSVSSQTADSSQQAASGSSNGESDASGAAGGTGNDGADTSGTNDGTVSNTDATSETGEQLLANAQGLTLSDDSVLSSASPEESGENTQNVNEAGQTGSKSESGTKDGEYRLSISWVLVFQCILIITIPPLCIMLVSGYFFHWLRMREKELEDDE